MSTSGRGRFELSRWARSRLADRVANQTERLSYLIPDGLGADIAHPAATVELLAAVMDAVLAHEACDERVLFELGQPESLGTRAVFLFRRHGGRSPLCVADHERLERLAHSLQAEVRIVQDTPTSLSAVVSLPIADRP